MAGYVYGKSKKSLRPAVAADDDAAWLRIIGPEPPELTPVAPEVRRARDRVRNVRDRCKRYGLSMEDYLALLDKATDGCYICHAALKPTSLAIDHDHGCCETLPGCGKCVRGLLCIRCNLGIERFDDDPILLRAAADYLERKRESVK